MSMPQGTAVQRTKRKKSTRQKHVPIRTCIACRETGAKRGLTRVVRSPEGDIAIDPTGKRNGRGAYLCEKPGCWDRATSTPLLSRALNAEIASDTAEQLKDFAAGLRTTLEAQPEAAKAKEPAQ